MRMPALLWNVPEFTSTNGAILTLVGLGSVFPLAVICKTQKVTSHSTPEAEYVYANEAIRIACILAHDLREVLVGRSIRLEFMEDNQSTIAVM